MFSITSLSHPCNIIVMCHLLSNTLSCFIINCLWSIWMRFVKSRQICSQSWYEHEIFDIFSKEKLLWGYVLPQCIIKSKIALLPNRRCGSSQFKNLRTPKYKMEWCTILFKNEILRIFLQLKGKAKFPAYPGRYHSLIFFFENK